MAGVKWRRKGLGNAGRTRRPHGPDYDDDFYAWTQYQAEVLRSMPCDDNRFDRENVAEEIEDLGKNTRDAVRSQVTSYPGSFFEAGLFAGRRSAARVARLDH